MVVTGDVTQIDLPREQRSGLVAVRDVLAGVEDVAFIDLDRGDVVRHRLVQRIVDAYALKEVEPA
jgi:phosphate starvation-inducible PhoH-like protein